MSTRSAWPAIRTIPACRPEGFQGIDAVLGTVDGMKKFVSIQESPYHGLNFCQGTVSEMLQDPGKEIFDVIRYFGSRKKIFNVHFRNIRGKRDDFQEVYPGRRRHRLREGDDGLQGSRVSVHDDARSRATASRRSWRRQAFAFAYGYIRALIQAVDQMG